MEAALARGELWNVQFNCFVKDNPIMTNVKEEDSCVEAMSSKYKQ